MPQSFNIESIYSILCFLQYSKFIELGRQKKVENSSKSPKIYFRICSSNFHNISSPTTFHYNLIIIS